MKKINRLFSLLLLLLLQLNLFAQDGNEKNKKYEFVKSKSFTKSYSVSSSDQLSIVNKFGKVEIHTWNKNEMKVDVEINVSAKTEDWAKSVLEDIQVEDSKSGGAVKFKTLIGEDIDKKVGGTKHSDKYNNKNTSQTMEVNYSVYMPANNPLTISNEFGATVLPDYTGDVDLSSKFGSLTTGALKSVKKIVVEFGKANFESISDANVSIKYSNATFGKLVGRIKLHFEFCGSTKVNIDGNLTALDVKADYSTVNIRPAANLPAAYNVFTSFGKFKNNTGIKFDEDKKDEESGPKFDNTYEGKSGAGTIPIKVNTSFGKIILGEASAEDLKEKGKSKSKTV